MTRRLLLALAAVSVLVVAVLIVASARDRGAAPPLRSGDLSAQALIDSIAVVVHFNYIDTAYGRQAEIVQRLRELGVRHVRDAMPSPNEPLAAGLQAARQAGIRATLATGHVERDPASAVADSLRIVGRAGIDAFEGPNELDNSGDPAWAGTLRDYMPALAAAVREQAPGVPVVGPSLIDSSNRAQLPADLPGLFNVHPYPGGGPPEPVIRAALGELPEGAIGKGVVFTETGYHNALNATTGQPPSSEEAAAVYIPRLLLTAFGAGVRRTFLYELIDEKPDPGLVDQEQHFGLLRNDLSPKPAFTAIQTLMTALRASAGESSRGRSFRDLRVSGEGRVEQLRLARADGSRIIALWRPVSVWDVEARQPVEPSPLPVELHFGLGARDVAVWRPSAVTQPVLRREHARRLELELRGDLVLVSFR